MKILFLAHRVPFPPNRGDRIRSFHLLRHLAARHEVHLACLADEAWTPETHDRLGSLCARVHIEPNCSTRRLLCAAQSFFAGRSITESSLAHPALSRKLESWAADVRYDVAVAYCSGMAPYLSAPSLRDVPCIVDLVDTDSLKWADYAADARGPSRLLYARESRLVARLEARCAARAAALTLVSEAEAQHAAYPGARVTVIPNGVDLEYFKPASEPAASVPPTCLFVGAMHYRPNVGAVTWFCDHVWTEVRRLLPTARFHIVGSRPTRAVRRLARHPGVEVTGSVPDIRPFLAGAHLVVAPLRLARGVQNKVLEALASGRAVIASTPAMTGLEVRDGVHLRRADSAAEWIDAVVEGLGDAAWRGSTAVAGRAFVERHHDWDSCLQPFDVLLHSVAAAPLASPGKDSAVPSPRSPSVAVHA